MIHCRRMLRHWQMMKIVVSQLQYGDFFAVWNDAVPVAAFSSWMPAALPWNLEIILDDGPNYCR